MAASRTNVNNFEIIRVSRHRLRIVRPHYTERGRDVVVRENVSNVWKDKFSFFLHTRARRYSILFYSRDGDESHASRYVY